MSKLSLTDNSFKCVTLVSPQNIIHQDGSDAQVTCLEALDHSIYVGTQTGDIIHFFEAEPCIYIVASWQKTYNKRPRKVADILVIPVLNTALTISGSITSVFTLPEFTPCADIGSMRDVRDVSRDVDEEIREKNGDSSTSIQSDGSVLVTVFTKNAIRVVAVKPDNLKMITKLDYKGAVAGVRRSSYALVSNSAHYDLIDINKNQKIPLVPVVSTSGALEPAEDDSTSETATVHSYNSANEDPSDIKPHISAVQDDEFLITTGTKYDESAVGLFVNTKGDITRGTIAFYGYPTCIAVDYPYVGATINNDICIYSIITQELIHSISYESKPMIKSVYARHTVESESLTDLLKPVSIGSEHSEDPQYQKCTISSSLFIYSKELGIQCLVPESNLIDIGSYILEGDMTTAKNIARENSNDINSYFIQLMLALGYVFNGNYSEATDCWLNGNLDPRILIYLFDSDIIGKVFIPSGSKDLADKIKSKLTYDEKLLSFYGHLLSSWLKNKDIKGIDEPSKLFYCLEIAKLRLILDPKFHRNGYITITNELSEMIDHGIDESLDKSIQVFVQYNRYTDLARLYRNRKMSKELLELWKKLLTKEIHDDRFFDGENRMYKYLTTLDNDDLIWEYGMWLVENYPDLGIKLFIDPKVSMRFDEERIINRLRGLKTDGPWRRYLRYLIYEKKSSLFVADLITFMIDDIVDKMSRTVGGSTRTVGEDTKMVGEDTKMVGEDTKMVGEDTKLDKKNMKSIEHDTISVRKDTRMVGQDTKSEGENTVTYEMVVCQGYSDYKALKLPKRSYPSYIESLKSRNDVGSDIYGLRLDLFELLSNEEVYDLDRVLHMLESDRANLLKFEKCIVYGRLNLDDRSLKTLCHDITDYSTAMNYCQTGKVFMTSNQLKSVPVIEISKQNRLFLILFHQLLTIDNEQDRTICIRQLLDHHGPHLDLDTVLKYSSDDWPVEMFQNYLISMFRMLVEHKNNSNIHRALLRSENTVVSNQLKVLEVKIRDGKREEEE